MWVSFNLAVRFFQIQTPVIQHTKPTNKGRQTNIGKLFNPVKEKSKYAETKLTGKSEMTVTTNKKG
jgi:hypothetical protein